LFQFKYDCNELANANELLNNDILRWCRLFS